MTKHTIYTCDGCEKEFSYSDVISWGSETHYCRQCAKLEIADMLSGDIETVRKLNFDGCEGRDVLEEIYGHIRLATISLWEREGEE